MESISELQEICQSTAKKDVSNVYMRYVCRPISIRLTRRILPSSVTADQVSQAMIAAGIFSALVLAFPWRGTFFIGALLLQLWYLIDCMDGEVARYRYYKQTGRISIDKRDTSLTGMYYDMINHYLMNFLVPAAMAFGLYLKSGALSVLLGGMLASLGQVLLLAMHDARSRAVLSHLRKYKTIRVVQAPASAEPVQKKERSPAHQAFMGVHYTMTYPSVMNLVLLAALLNGCASHFDWRGPLLLYLAVGSALVSTVLIVRAIQSRQPDEELRTDFALSDE